MALLGVDTGGTFTDFVLYNNNTLTVHKVPSTPASPADAILQGIAELQLKTGLDLQALKVIHGSTVATNAVLEGKGVKTVYITNTGLKDVLLIGRQARKSLYNLQPEPVTHVERIVQQDLCLEVNTRVSAEGKTIQPLTDEAINQLVEQIKNIQPVAVAINLLFSFLDGRAEKIIEERLQLACQKSDSLIFISRSSRILPEYKEYERGMTTWLNAYVGPLVQNYLQQLQANVLPAKLSIMMSHGGTANAKQAGLNAVNMLLSGPAGGLQAAKFVGDAIGQKQLLTFDMGGTSTDVALIDGEIKLSNEAKIAGLPVALPMVDMHTIGAGGGSIALVDDGGLLQVGPLSAGASPGPACYGNGGEKATVTDAHVVLGRIPAEAALGGALQLDYDAAASAVGCLAEKLNCSLTDAAIGIIRLANEHMSQALRMISVQKGTDPRDFSLISFGGAGGLHVCDLAESMGMSSAIVPMNAGVLSAFGMLVSPVSRELSKAYIGLLSDLDMTIVDEEYRQLIEAGMSEMQDEGVEEAKVLTSLSMDLRYKGQSFTLNIAWQGVVDTLKLFHETHVRLYGHSLEMAEKAVPVEVINLRVSLKAPTESLNLQPAVEVETQNVKNEVFVYGLSDSNDAIKALDQISVPLYLRNNLAIGQKFEGPALIIEKVATILVKPYWQCEVVKGGHLKLQLNPVLENK